MSGGLSEKDLLLYSPPLPALGSFGSNLPFLSIVPFRMTLVRRTPIFSISFSGFWNGGASGYTGPKYVLLILALGS